MAAASDPLAEFLKGLEVLQPLAEKVASLKASTIEQETAALEKILEKIKPLLPVATHKIKINYYFSGQQFHSEKEEYHQLKGLVLIDNYEKVYTDRDTRGDYAGWQLILFEDGSLQTLKRVGEWSRWQGEPSYWSIEAEETIQPEDAIKRYRLDELVQGLASEFEAATKKLEKLQADYTMRLELIQKVEEVLQ